MTVANQKEVPSKCPIVHSNLNLPASILLKKVARRAGRRNRVTQELKTQPIIDPDIAEKATGRRRPLARLALSLKYVRFCLFPFMVSISRRTVMRRMQKVRLAIATMPKTGSPEKVVYSRGIADRAAIVRMAV